MDELKYFMKKLQTKREKWPYNAQDTKRRRK